MERSFSYPKSMKEIKDEEFSKSQSKIIEITEVLNVYREKDHDRTEMMARSGSVSSREIRTNNIFMRAINYLLERGEQERKKEEEIKKLSYAGIYYFTKWFTRSVFLLIFTTLASIAGKEVGCAIKDHDTCDVKAIDLSGNSPHILATIIGSIFGLVIGQWCGKIVWEKLEIKCLFFLENYRKRFIVLLYIICISFFSVIFHFFVKIGDTKFLGTIVGCFLGIFLGIILNLISRKK